MRLGESVVHDPGAHLPWGGNARNPRDTLGMSLATAWGMYRALLAGMAAAGVWTKGLDELRDAYSSSVGVDGRGVVLDEDDDLDAG